MTNEQLVVKDNILKVARIMNKWDDTRKKDICLLASYVMYWNTKQITNDFSKKE